MSLIIGLKDKEGVVHMIADTQITKGVTKINQLSEINYKILRPLGVENALLGIVGLSRLSSFLSQTNFEVRDPKNITYTDVVKNVVPKIFAVSKEVVAIKKDDDEVDAIFMLAQGNKLFNISDIFVVSEIDDYMAIGQGKFSAMGILKTHEHLPPKERLLLAVTVTAEFCPGVSGPYIYINTKDLTYEVIEGK